MTDLVRLRHIVAVARNRSFSRAAEDEGITQPALSRSIAAFEQHHAVRLFDRGRGGVHPTAVGLYVIEKAEKLLAAADDLNVALKQYPVLEVRQISIGLGPLMAALFLPRVSATLMSRFPGIRINAIVRRPDQLVSELMNDRIEMILGNNWNMGRLPGAVVHRLGSLKIGCMVRAGHPILDRTKITMNDLGLFPSASAIDQSLQGVGVHAGGIVCTDFYVLRETVLRSDCVWMSSPVFLSSEVRGEQIVEVDVADMDTTESAVSLIERNGRTSNPASIAVRDGISEMLAELALTSEVVSS